MKNSLIDEYIFYLKNFKTEHPSMRDRIDLLITKLGDVKSLTQALNILSMDEEPKKNVQGSFFTKYQKNEDDSQLLDETLELWKVQIATFNRSVSSMQALLTLQQPSGRVKPLNALLKEILFNSASLLHCQAPSLLRCLESNKLKAIYDFLNQVEKRVNPVVPTKGSFASLKPLNENHRDCIALMYDLVDKPDFDNPVWNDCNSLFQCLLVIHRDYNAPTPKPPEPPPQTQSGCIIS